ncbi:aminoglycoside phosphotransferase family protein [Asaia bogorensis]|uniref:aminoglycoside phosphotransferase family protein n=1 Tax=Asaia bogorensis TaxID=91915 RepID=UPI000EFD3133|nr:aminoglycoside phosphotransferase family protein [Asaia bogorensis]
MCTFYLDRWHLVPDGDSIVTNTSHLLPVIRQGHPAMLKLTVHEDERLGAGLMAWWDGAGAALVLAQEGDALLMTRAMETGSLASWAWDGRDDEACRILCANAARLHAPRATPLLPLMRLAERFAALAPMATAYGGIMRRCDAAARSLLASPRDIVPLHGDLRHENVLDFGSDGWLAIDPKGVLGERGFDFSNIFCNPHDEEGTICSDPDRFRHRLAVVTEAANLERERQLLWILAWCGLSTAWCLKDDPEPPFEQLELAEIAAAELDRLA